VDAADLVAVTPAATLESTAYVAVAGCMRMLLFAELRGVTVGDTTSIAMRMQISGCSNKWVVPAHLVEDLWFEPGVCLGVSCQ